MNAADDKLPLLFLAAAGALTYWLWRREQSAAQEDPQTLPEPPQSVPVNVQGPSFVEDDPTDEILQTILDTDLARRPYSLSYQSGGTTLYTRFVDDFTNLGELGAAERQAWLNSLRKPTAQIQPE